MIAALPFVPDAANRGYIANARCQQRGAERASGLSGLRPV